MRTYSIFTPQRWIGGTGKNLRRGIQSRQKGDPERETFKDAQIVADMLVNNPAANMYGLYYITLGNMADLTGLDVQEIRDALALLQREEFAYYDPTTEFVWVREMARVQMFLPLKPGDKNVKTANRWYLQLPRNPYLGRFYDRYADDLHLQDRRDEWREERLPGMAEQTSAHGGGPDLFQQWFLLFLEAYPSSRRVGGAAGEQAFARAMRGRGEEHLVAMIEALYYQKHSEQWMRGVIPGMVKWLDEQQWTRDLRRDMNAGRVEAFTCEHGCRSVGQHILRGELTKACQHEPPCESWIEHYNQEAEGG